LKIEHEVETVVSIHWLPWTCLAVECWVWMHVIKFSKLQYKTSMHMIIFISMT